MPSSIATGASSQTPAAPSRAHAAEMSERIERLDSLFYEDTGRRLCGGNAAAVVFVYADCGLLTKQCQINELAEKFNRGDEGVFDRADSPISFSRVGATKQAATSGGVAKSGYVIVELDLDGKKILAVHHGSQQSYIPQDCRVGVPQE